MGERIIHREDQIQISVHEQGGELRIANATLAVAPIHLYDTEALSTPRIDVYENVQSFEDVPELVDDIHSVVCSAFDKPDFDLEDTKAHINGDVLMVAYSGEQPVGFHTFMYGSPRDLLRNESLPDKQGCYFSATAVAKEAQGQGTFKAINESRFAILLERNVDLVFARTQNPLIETGISHHLQRLVDRGAIGEFSLERKLLRGHYGQMLSAERPPTSNDPEIQAAFDELRPEDGDAFVLMFSMQK